MGNTQVSTEQEALGDAWWDYAPKATGVVRSQIISRAAVWYEMAANQLSGLSKAHVDSRLKEIATVLHGPPIPVEVLSSMKDNGKVQRQNGIVVLSRDGHLSTLDRFHPPIAFHLQVMTDEKDFRLQYAADQLILNWEGNKDELRIDGGPANRKYKKGAGRLPAGRWVSIDFVVNSDELLLSVDGDERYQIKADFRSD